MSQSPPPSKRDARADEPQMWVFPGDPEYEASLRALEQGGDSVTWKDSARCLQAIQRLFPKVPLPKATSILAKKAASAVRQHQRMRRLTVQGFDDQIGTKFDAGPYTVFMHWTVVDESVVSPAIFVTSCHEDGK